MEILGVEFGHEPWDNAIEVLLHKARALCPAVPLGSVAGVGRVKDSPVGSIGNSLFPAGRGCIQGFLKAIARVLAFLKTVLPVCQSSDVFPFIKALPCLTGFVKVIVKIRLSRTSPHHPAEKFRTGRRNIQETDVFLELLLVSQLLRCFFTLRNGRRPHVVFCDIPAILLDMESRTYGAVILDFDRSVQHSQDEDNRELESLAGVDCHDLDGRVLRSQP